MKNQALEDCIRALKKRFPPPKFKNRKKKVMNRSGMLIAPGEPQRIRDMKEGILGIYE